MSDQHCNYCDNEEKHCICARCDSCGKPFSDHLGVVGTCAELLKARAESEARLKASVEWQEKAIALGEEVERLKTSWDDWARGFADKLCIERSEGTPAHRCIADIEAEVERLQDRLRRLLANDDANSEIQRQLRDEVERLRNALDRFGTHGPCCAYILDRTNKASCDCGWVGTRDELLRYNVEEAKK